jgi:hypothetical protein
MGREKSSGLGEASIASRQRRAGKANRGRLVYNRDARDWISQTVRLPARGVIHRMFNHFESSLGDQSLVLHGVQAGTKERSSMTSVIIF